MWSLLIAVFGVQIIAKCFFTFPCLVNASRNSNFEFSGFIFLAETFRTKRWKWLNIQSFFQIIKERHFFAKSVFLYKFRGFMSSFDQTDWKRYLKYFISSFFSFEENDGIFSHFIWIWDFIKIQGIYWHGKTTLHLWLSKLLLICEKLKFWLVSPSFGFQMLLILKFWVILQ